MNELVVNPQGFFQLDFSAILDEARRQESIHSANAGEYSIATSMQTFFEWHVMRLIREDSWVFEAATTFAEKYAYDCFRYLKLQGQETFRVQQNLHKVNDSVITMLAEMNKAGATSKAGKVELTKASDFISLINRNKLNARQLRQVEQLHEDAIDHEDLQMWATLRAMRDAYETPLPRIMYVVRRVMKRMKGLPPKSFDSELTGISKYLDWYEAHADIAPLLSPVLSELRPFYKVARNVGNHHKGLSWQASTNRIILKDENDEVNLHVHEFQQRYRYLVVYLCEFGLRGILAAFCGREQGAVSDNLVKEYAKTFPEDFPEGTPGRVRFYLS